jgi:cytochrome c oxidase cbb3-type subunit III
MTQGWSWYVIALVTLNIVGCVWLLWWTGRRKPGDPAPTDTSHVWDGDITEYNKPMPRWWINMFYLTIAFAIGYLVLYPGLGAFAGTSGWTSASEHDAQQAADNRKLEATFARFAGQPIDVLARDPKARAIGRSIFGNTCAGCHGSTARGAIGYPNLTDDIWHWGSTPDHVLKTVLDGRDGVMPPWGQVLTGIGGDNAVDYTVAYVRSLSDPAQQKDFMPVRGKPLFDSVCAACHGASGKGNPDLGAPDLTDAYWLYGGSPEAIARTVRDGRHGIMPAHRALLGETRARLVASYVWSLSHPPNTPAKQ